jgi:hypothetical protein
MSFRTLSRTCVHGFLAVGLTILAGFAPAPINRTDNFNNNLLANFWRVRSFGNAAVTEANKRLEFSRTGANGALSAAGVQFKPYGIDWTQPFSITWKGRLNVPAPAGSQKCFMGTVLFVDGQYPLSMTGVGIGFLRDVTGQYFGVVEFTNGAITDFTGTVSGSTWPSNVTIAWDPSIDKFTAIATPGPFVPHFGFEAAYGDDYGDLPMTIVQGILIIGGNMTITGARANMDNWSADFVRRDFP